MLNTKSFLAVDFGAGSLKIAEFEQNEAGGLRVKQYGIKSLGAEGAQEGTRESSLIDALKELLSENKVGQAWQVLLKSHKEVANESLVS